MNIYKVICPVKFRFVHRVLSRKSPRILDIGCANDSPLVARRWFPDCFYAGADIRDYEASARAAMDEFYLVGADGSGYEAIPSSFFDFIILNHVIEHMNAPEPILANLCKKLKPGGYIWIAFPSTRSLSLPSAVGTLHFCDDPTHIRLPDIRETTNVLLRHGVKVLHAGRSRPFVRMALGVILLPVAMLRRAVTGRFASRGLWYILGFEDHVFGQRKPE